MGNTTEEKDEYMITFEALMNARKAFEETLRECGYDSAYWDIKFIAYLVDERFKQRLSKIEYESELKKEE